MHGTEPELIILLRCGSQLQSNVLESLSNPFARSGILASIPGQLRDRVLKLVASHYCQYTLHRLQFPELLPTDEEIVFRDQLHKIEIELPGGGFDTEARVGHVAGDICGDGRMREFPLCVPIDV